MRIVVTGGSGRIGSALVPHLARYGHDVLSIDRHVPKDTSHPHRVVDLRDEPAVRDALAGAEAVCHLGEIPNMDSGPSAHGLFGINTTIGALVMEAAADAGARHIIYTSSCQAYGFYGGEATRIDPTRLPLTEDEPLQPQNAYGVSKAANELYARQFAHRRRVPVTAFRFPAVASESWYARWMGHRLERGLKPIGRQDFGTHLHMDDAVEAYRLALDIRSPGFEAFHFVEDEILCPRPVREMFLELYPAAPLPEDWPEAAAPVSTEKARRMLGWTPKNNMRQRYLKALEARAVPA